MPAFLYAPWDGRYGFGLNASKEGRIVKKKIFLLSLSLCVISLCTMLLLFTYLQKEQLGFDEIQNGNFDNVCSLSVEMIRELEKVYDVNKNINDWLLIDVNSDGKEELVWREKNNEQFNVIAIFAMQEKECKRVLWDIYDAGEYHLVVNDTIIYFWRYSGAYERYSFCAVEFDAEFNKDYREIYEVIRITDVEEAKAVWEDCKEGTYYIKTIIDDNNDMHKEERSYEEWLRDFENAIGKFDFEEMLQ